MMKAIAVYNDTPHESLKNVSPNRMSMRETRMVILQSERKSLVRNVFVYSLGIVGNKVALSSACSMPIFMISDMLKAVSPGPHVISYDLSGSSRRPE